MRTNKKPRIAYKPELLVVGFGGTFVHPLQRRTAVQRLAHRLHRAWQRLAHHARGLVRR